MKIDCHCHTIYSRHWFWRFDALNTPLELIKAAIKRGLDGLAITDHNTVKGSLVAEKVAKRFKNFTIITGSEIKTKEGEIIGLGIKEDVPMNLGMEETIERIHDLGGIAVVPHPFANSVFRRCVGSKAVRGDAVEVLNSGNFIRRVDKKAMNLAREFKKPMTAGSDAHSTGEVGNAGIICHGDPIDDILKKRVKIFGGYTPYLTLSFNLIKKFVKNLKWRVLKDLTLQNRIV